MIALVAALFLADAGPALVDVSATVPRAVLDLRYATGRNFMRRRVYAHARCLLRPETAQALARVEAVLEKQGYRLKLWDCYRPSSVQRAMWRIVPVRGLVADPARGGSNHNRGTAVDASLVDLDGREVAMPSDFDDFGKAGRRDGPCADSVAEKHRVALRAAMAAEGFTTIKLEWWHFDAPQARKAQALDVPL